MNMNFFKKVMTFFSILWNTIWRRTGKDKKSKSVAKVAGEVELELQGETRPGEVTAKSFVNPPSEPPIENFADEFQQKPHVDEGATPPVYQEVSELNSPIVAQALNCLVTKSTIESESRASQLFLEEVDDTHSVPTFVEEPFGLNEEGNYLAADEKTNVLITEESLKRQISENDPKMETPAPVKSSISLNDYKASNETDVLCDDPVIPQLCELGMENEEFGRFQNQKLELDDYSSLSPQDRTSHDSHPPMDVPFPDNDLILNNSKNPTSDNEMASEDEEKLESKLFFAESPSKSISQINAFDERTSIPNETHSSMDNIMSTDGSYLPFGDTQSDDTSEADGTQEIYPSGTIELLSSREENMVQLETESQLAASETILASPSPEYVDNTTEGIPRFDNDSASNVQTSVSALKLPESRKCGEVVPDDNYSTNYMVRSDSLVNFFPSICNQDGPDLPPTINLRTDSKEDAMLWIGQKEEPQFEKSQGYCQGLSSNVVERNTLEEIMCTSTGILKLSDSNCEIPHRYGPDDSILAESTMIPEEKEKEDQTVPGSLAPIVFMYDPSDGKDEEGSHETKDERIGSPLHANYTKMEETYETKGKMEVCDRICSKNSESGTLESIDELSYDPNADQIGSLLHESEDITNDEEYDTDSVTILRRMSDQNLHYNESTVDENLPLLSRGGYSHGNDEIYNNKRPDDFRRNCRRRSYFGGMSTEESDSFEKNEKCNVLLDSVRKINFPEHVFPQMMNIDYTSNGPTMFETPSYITNISTDENVPFVSVGMGNFTDGLKWEPQVSFPVPTEDTSEGNFESGDVRFMAKNETAFYSHVKPESKMLDDSSGSYSTSRANNEFYPFIDSTSYIFGIPEGARRDEYFNPCVGAAPSGRSSSAKQFEGFKYEKFKYDETKAEDQNTLISRRDHSWTSLAQNSCIGPVTSGLLPINEELGAKFTEGPFGPIMEEIPERGELTQHRPFSQTSGHSWNACDEMSPIETASYHDGYEMNECLDTVRSRPIAFLGMDYGQRTGSDNNQEEVCDISNSYELINPYSVGVLPVLNIPFVLPDPTFTPRGTLPPFIFPIGPMNIESTVLPTELGANGQIPNQNNLYPISSQPYWVRYQMDDEASQIGTPIDNEHSVTCGNYQQLLPRDSGSQGDEDTPDDYTIPDPFFQLAENSSLHSVKSKADSYNGSLFCESLRSLLSSHNAESDNVISSFSCSSVRCLNPSLVLRSCENSLSNDSLPSIIVEESCSKTVDEDYSAKEKFMNDVNTALNQSVMDQIQSQVDQYETSQMGHGDYEADVGSTGIMVDMAPGQMEQILLAITEDNDKEFNFNERSLSFDVFETRIPVANEIDGGDGYNQDYSEIANTLEQNVMEITDDGEELGFHVEEDGPGEIKDFFQGSDNQCEEEKCPQQQPGTSYDVQEYPEECLYGENNCSLEEQEYLLEEQVCSHVENGFPEREQEYYVESCPYEGVYPYVEVDRPFEEGKRQYVEQEYYNEELVGRSESQEYPYTNQKCSDEELDEMGNKSIGQESIDEEQESDKENTETYKIGETNISEFISDYSELVSNIVNDEKDCSSCIDQHFNAAQLIDQLIDGAVHTALQKENDELMKIVKLDSNGELIERVKSRDGSINSEDADEHVVQQIVGFVQEDSIRGNIKLPLSEESSVIQSHPTGWESSEEKTDGQDVDIGFIVKQLLDQQLVLELQSNEDADGIVGLCESGICLGATVNLQKDDVSLSASNYKKEGTNLVDIDVYEPVTEKDELSTTDQNPRKNKRNRRRKKKGATETSEVDEVVALSEIAIGDNSQQEEILGVEQLCPDSVLEKNSLKVDNHKPEASPEVMKGVAEGNRVTEEDEEQCEENQEGDHDERDGSLGNSSNNRKKRNRRKKRKN